MSMTRAPALSIVLLGIGSYLILERRLRWLAVLSFVFVWTYSLFPLIVVFAAAHAITVYLAQRRVDLSALVASGAGVVAGLVWEHLGMKVTAQYPVDVGVEWYPYETWAMLESSALAFAIYFVALVAFDFRARARDQKPLFFLIISLVFLLMAFKSRRFIEYWPPFAVLFAAITLGGPLKRFNHRIFARPLDRAVAAVAAALVIVVMIVAMGLTLWQARENVKSETDPAAYKGASEWIAANTPAGSMIFNTDWDDFPMLYYYNPNNSYIVGLDPTYLYDRDQQLWKLYARITLGNEPDPAPLIRDRFGAQYVFTDNYHRDFLEIADRSGDFETVYKDSYTTVLRVLGPRQPGK
jgi:asparagine N-glycosylation enzyme membrane subunit Stt3